MKTKITTLLLVVVMTIPNCFKPKEKSDPLMDLLLLLFLPEILSSLTSLSNQTNPGTTPAPQVTGPDPLYQYQWHLKNNGGWSGTSGFDSNVEPVWNAGTTGSNVNVVVVDDGVDLQHEDLSGNINSALNRDYTNQLPNQVNGTVACDSGNACHGTAVAGIIGAIRNNSLGGAGAAPSSRISGRNLLLSSNASFSANSAEAMSRDVANIHVSNNSWGATDSTGNLNAGMANLAWRNAIETGLSTGRSDRGTLYFWAAGNGATPKGTATNFPETDNSNYDGQANFYGVMAIGALGNDGRRATYSERGANLWVSAYSEGLNATRIVTTDISGTAGYNFHTSRNPYGTGFTNNYTNFFNGTSAATPLAAGVAALVLDANPNLTWRDARIILAKSARKVDTTNGDYVYNQGGTSGERFSDIYGFGAVDAGAAVTMARTWTNVGAEIVSSEFENATTGTIVDFGAELTRDIAVSGTNIGKIEYIEVYLTVNSSGTTSGDLQVKLQNVATGVEYFLGRHRPCVNSSNQEINCTAYDNWRFGVSGFLDVPANGTWRLRLEDMATGANPYGSSSTTAVHTGNHTFQNWKIKFRGRAN